MSHCPGPEELLASLIETRPPDARAALTLHLAGCAPCRERFERLRALGYNPPGSGGAHALVDGMPPPARAEVNRSGADRIEPACAPRENLAAMIAGRLASEDARRVRAHVVDCARCLLALNAVMYEARERRVAEAENAARPLPGPRRRIDSGSWRDRLRNWVERHGRSRLAPRRRP